jgi:hypothetical protein
VTLSPGICQEVGANGLDNAVGCAVERAASFEVFVRSPSTGQDR